jgi:hypothetical protein
VAVLALAGTASCDLVTKDEATHTITLPVATYTIDTNGRNVGFPSRVLETPCAQNLDCCPDSSCRQNGYTLECSSGQCQARAVEPLVFPVDLSANSIIANARAVTAIKLLTLEYQVCDNTLSIPIEQVDVYAASETFTTQKGGARKIGVLPLIEAGRDRACTEAVSVSGINAAWAQGTLVSEAETAFAEVAMGGRSLFNAIITAPLVMRPLEGPPSGSLVLRLSGSVEVTIAP